MENHFTAVNIFPEWDLNPEPPEWKLLEYIQLTCEALGLGVYDPDLGVVVTDAHHQIFAFRYNYTPLAAGKDTPSDELRHYRALEKWKKRLDDYQADKRLQTLIGKAGLNSEYLWYFTLWASDYAYGQCQDNIICWRSARETVEELADAIAANIKAIRWANKNTYLRCVETDEPVSLTLKIGKKTLHTDDTRVTALIAAALQQIDLDNIAGGLNSSSFDFNTSNTASDARTTALFCRLMEGLLDHLPERVALKRPEAVRTNAERELTLRLACLTGLLRLDLKPIYKGGKEILPDFKSYYKTLMKRYKDDHFESINRYYDGF